VSRAPVSTSCAQFNNVLASLLHALALSRLLCRTLLLPGFFVRFGARLTRVSNFEERWLPTSNPDPNPDPNPNRKPGPHPNPNPHPNPHPHLNQERWLPTSHFFELARLRASFHVRDLDEWLAEVRQGAGQGAGAALQRPEVLHMRGEGGRAAQLRFFSYHNLSFAREAPLTFPHFMQQQSEMRWVSDTILTLNLDPNPNPNLSPNPNPDPDY
jgi:hypothetical protein